MPLRPRLQDIPNFEKVTPLLLRGGQPSRRGIKWLIDYGVRAVVDLRGSDRQNQWVSIESWGPIKLLNIAIEDFEAPTIEQVSQRQKLFRVPTDRFASHPLPSRHFIDKLDWVYLHLSVYCIEQMFEFVDLTEDPDNQPLFVHCKAGVGRTGTIVACWRVSTGESVEEALRKERLYSADGGGLRQEAFIRNFAEEWRRRTS